jgi:hypothetical protein
VAECGISAFFNGKERLPMCCKHVHERNHLAGKPDHQIYMASSSAKDESEEEESDDEDAGAAAVAALVAALEDLQRSNNTVGAMHIHRRAISLSCEKPLVGEVEVK